MLRHVVGDLWHAVAVGLSERFIIRYDRRRLVERQVALGCYVDIHGIALIANRLRSDYPARTVALGLSVAVLDRGSRDGAEGEEFAVVRLRWRRELAGIRQVARIVADRYRVSGLEATRPEEEDVLLGLGVGGSRAIALPRK